MVDNEKFIIKKIWKSKEVPEGDGGIVRRGIGISEGEDMDPFLLFDHAQMKLPTGFPDHPHRGFETVSYILKGTIIHEDFKGHKGKIGPGDVQWMTAGKGIVHSEMPGSFTEDSMGFQLWINLNKENKMCEPKYQEFTKEKIPKIQINNSESYVKVISGEYNGVEGPVKSVTSVHYYDVFLNNNESSKIKVIKGKVNCFIYVYDGDAISVLGKRIKQFDCAKIIKDSDKEESLEFSVSSNQNASFLVMLGRPLEEPVVKYGPFVMNTEDEIVQAFEDYKSGKNGFENALKWKSKNHELKYQKNK